eukprot:COSAG01_NODE_51005_length_358_cov_1.108108_1_plen_44_part_10
MVALLDPSWHYLTPGAWLLLAAVASASWLLLAAAASLSCLLLAA